MRRLYFYLLLLPLACGCKTAARCALFVLECTDSQTFQEKLQEEDLKRQAEVRQVQRQMEEEAMRE